MARRIKLVLDQFLQVSGGLINNNKSQIYVWNSSAQRVIGIAQILGFPISVDWNIFKYLGLPICLNSIPRRILAHSDTKNQGENGILGEIWLNLVGCLVLVKSVLSSLPLFNSLLYWHLRE
jgi:hypothetical protein